VLGREREGEREREREREREPETTNTLIIWISSTYSRSQTGLHLQFVDPVVV